MTTWGVDGDDGVWMYRIIPWMLISLLGLLVAWCIFCLIYVLFWGSLLS